jgi:hypothetical protein
MQEFSDIVMIEGAPLQIEFAVGLVECLQPQVVRIPVDVPILLALRSALLGRGGFAQYDLKAFEHGTGTDRAPLDLLEHVPDDHPEHHTVLDSFTRLCHAVQPLQDDSGFFHHILDDPWTAKETSGTLQFAYTFDRAVERGYLPEDEGFQKSARRAFDACTGVVSETGDVTRVAVPPGGPDVPLGVASYGQGWFLLAAAQLNG